MTPKLYSNCCGALLDHRWPESDLCPRCKDHCDAEDLSDYESEVDQLREDEVFEAMYENSLFEGTGND